MTILDSILESTRRRVEEAKSRVSPVEMAAKAKEADPPRDFFSAVQAKTGPEQTAVIAEIKRRSPSAGEIRADFDPVDIAKQYDTNGAAALSCLTEPEFFGGDLAYIEQIKEAVPLPVLRKDFLIASYQVNEARAAGADAVLLIAECLTEQQLGVLLELSESLSMTTLLETYTEENLEVVVDLLVEVQPQRALLGINNRDLTRMKTDIGHTAKLVSKIADRSHVVSESGISTPADLEFLRELDVHIVLVGESLMREEDPGEALAKLLG
jgi:indole-3-glycerol phosphate synthase